MSDDLAAYLDRRRQTKEQRFQELELKKRQLANVESLADYHEIKYANPAPVRQQTANRGR